jgi:outer membrane protein assembly factor BamE (lipoprotein component of BamABCDE complex)
MFKRIHTEILIIIICICVTGCVTENSTSGFNFDGTKASQITKGNTTEDQVSALFGPPTSKKPEAYGAERWIYFFQTTVTKAQAGYGTTTSNAKGNEKTLNVLFDKNGIVLNFTYVEGPSTPITFIIKDSGDVWTIGFDIDTNKVSQIIKGTTTVDQIIPLLGSPATKEPLADNSQYWVYSYLKRVSEKSLFTKEKSTAYKKELQLLINSNNIVSDVIFNEGPFENGTISSKPF